MNIETVRTLLREGRREKARAQVRERTNVTPNDAELRCEAACVHDHLGLEAEAASHDRAVIAGDLGAEKLRSACLAATPERLFSTAWRAFPTRAS